MRPQAFNVIQTIEVWEKYKTARLSGMSYRDFCKENNMDFLTLRVNFKRHGLPSMTLAEIQSYNACEKEFNKEQEKLEDEFSSHINKLKSIKIGELTTYQKEELEEFAEYGEYRERQVFKKKDELFSLENWEASEEVLKVEPTKKWWQF